MGRGGGVRITRSLRTIKPNTLAPDGYRYGVMFNDGSVSHRWNGANQRERAQEAAATILLEQITYLRGTDRQPDNITLCRRLPDGEWERVDP